MHALWQDQINELLLWDRPDSCSLSCFTRIGSISDGRVVSSGMPKRPIHNQRPASAGVKLEIHTLAVDAGVVVEQSSTAAAGSSAAKKCAGQQATTL